jgi:hypothetical protein
MNRRRFVAAAAACLAAQPALARRSGDRGARGTRGPRGPRQPRAPRTGRRVTVVGVWAIGLVLLLEGSGEECEVVDHDGYGNSICLLRD